MNKTDLNWYLNWVLYAVLGRTGTADQIMRHRREGIHRVARFLVNNWGTGLKVPLHRGVLLEPVGDVYCRLACQEGVESVSFTEDERVARWFADPGSVVSGAVAELHPGSRGYLMRCEPAAEDVLFHHTWPVSRSLPLLAAMHPDVDERQLSWNLRTQREVVLKPHRPLRIEPFTPGEGETRALDELLCWPGAL